MAGYNKHLPDDMLIPLGDLKIGDILVAQHSPTVTDYFDPWPNAMEVKSFINGVVKTATNITVTPTPRNGKVWIRARKSDGVEIFTDSLQVGDVITGWVHGTGTMPTSQPHWTVTRMYRNNGGVVTAFYASRNSRPGTCDEIFWEIPQGPLRLRVITNAKQQQAAPVKKVIDPYPDFCTRCGAPAYLGLFEVEHKNEAAATDCPARRK